MHLLRHGGGADVLDDSGVRCTPDDDDGGRESDARMLYARIFSDPNPREHKQAVAQTSTLGSVPARGSLPPATPTNIPAAGRGQVRTNELAQPPSVTEHTTRLLDNE